MIKEYKYKNYIFKQELNSFEDNAVDYILYEDGKILFQCTSNKVLDTKDDVIKEIESMLEILKYLKKALV